MNWICLTNLVIAIASMFLWSFFLWCRASEFVDEFSPRQGAWCIYRWGFWGI